MYFGAPGGSFWHGWVDKGGEGALIFEPPTCRFPVNVHGSEGLIREGAAPLLRGDRSNSGEAARQLRTTG